MKKAFSWEEDVYAKGNQLNLYPYDSVVSFVFSHTPKNKSRDAIKVLELGSGAGNNIWFLAREGFSTYGIDISSTALDFCKKRLTKDNLEAELSLGDFSDLPFPDNYFDLVLDRGSISCCSPSDASNVFQEVKRVLINSGKFLFTPYSKSHTSFTKGSSLLNGMISNIKEGLVGVGDLLFYGETDIVNSFDNGWNIISLKHKKNEVINKVPYTHAEWEVVVIKSNGSEKN